MAIIQLQQQRSPWEQMLPQILGQLALMKVQQNFEAKQGEIEREHELKKEAITKQYDIAIKRQEAERKFGEEPAKKGGRRYMMTPAGLVYAKEPSKAVTSKTAPAGTTQITSPEGRKYMIPPPIPVQVGGQTIGYQRGTEFIKAGPESVTNINIGKTLPAEQAGQIGEFRAYQDTLKDIQTMVAENKIDTGPFEFIKERIDNWGIMPNKERIELRTLVARLPGLMYAMRGKQLSDKELEVALKMMPQMNVTEEVFKVQLDKFADYMNKVLAGKKAAFGGAGYNVGAFENQSQTNSQSRLPLDNFYINR